MSAVRNRRSGQAVHVMWLLPMTMSRSLMLAAAAVLVLVMLVSIQCAFTVSGETENNTLDLRSITKIINMFLVVFLLFLVFLRIVLPNFYFNYVVPVAKENRVEQGC